MFNVKVYYKQYRVDHKVEIEEYIKQWRQENPEYDKKRYENNKEEQKERSRTWFINNPERRKKYLEDNAEHRKEYYKEWYKNNPKVRKIRMEYKKNRRKTDLNFNLNERMGTAVWAALRCNKAGRHWETLVGYTLDDLIKHLKKTLPKGYTWQDLFNGKLHIDHIIPKSVFNYDNPEHIDFKRCWSLKNLRLLSARENIIKNNRLTKPFQPALKLIEGVV